MGTTLYLQNLIPRSYTVIAVVRGCAALFLQAPIRGGGVRRIMQVRALRARTRYTLTSPKTLFSNVARNRDWALIEYVEQPLTNSDVESKPQGRLEAAKFNSLGGTMPVSVVYHRTVHTGRLNAVPTSAIVPGGGRPFSVNTFSFGEAPSAYAFRNSEQVC
jgi:hypothetical protein